MPRSARYPAGSTRAWRQRRAWWERELDAGAVLVCPRCAGPICAGMAWDLDHHQDDGDDSNTRPAHRTCNRSSGGTIGGHRRAANARLRAATNPQVDGTFFSSGRLDPQPLSAVFPPAIVIPPGSSAIGGENHEDVGGEGDAAVAVAGRPPCDLDPLTFIVAVAFWHPVANRWAAPKHGCAVGNVEAMDECGCPLCVEGAEKVRAWRRGPEPPPPPPVPERPKVVDVGPVRRHVLGLLASGMTRRQVAVAAGIDATTITRVLRDGVARVHADTATALLAVSASSPRRADPAGAVVTLVPNIF